MSLNSSPFTPFETPFDLNINNYSAPQLKQLLNLQDNYSEDDLNKKMSDFSNKVGNIKEPSFQASVLDFLNQVKNLLLPSSSNENKLTGIDSSHFIIDGNNHNLQTTNFVQATYQTNISKGTVNNIKQKTTVATFCVNTVFRNDLQHPSTDCTVVLPYTIQNASSIELVSMEIPQSIYLISSYLKSNTIFFREYDAGGHVIGEELVSFLPGNYNTSSSTPSNNIQNMMQSVLNASVYLTHNFVVGFDLITNQITISNLVNSFDMEIIYPMGTNNNITRTMGWILGYRKPIYSGSKTYTAESIYNNTPSEYLYLELNDFNVQQTASKVFGLFSESYLDKDILAKVEYTRSTSYTSYDTVAYSKN
jgi:hypothetical protein